jgi:hypothetical protein
LIRRRVRIISLLAFLAVPFCCELVAGVTEVLDINPVVVQVSGDIIECAKEEAYRVSPFLFASVDSS